jgi:hypothetical protein
MGRRISTATAVSEVWDSHQATLHRPCCVQKAGSKTGVAMKSQNPSKSAGGLKQCPFCIQSEMMILRYLKSPTPFLVDWELSAMRPKKNARFQTMNLMGPLETSPRWSLWVWSTGPGSASRHWFIGVHSFAILKLYYSRPRDRSISHFTTRIYTLLWHQAKQMWTNESELLTVSWRMLTK